MKIDMTELLLFFNELMPATDEEQGVFWFRTVRPDDLIITFVFSIYEAHVSIIICNTSKIDIVSLSFENCSEIRVLDQASKSLEVLHGNENKRCFLSLLKSPILQYKN